MTNPKERGMGVEREGISAPQEGTLHVQAQRHDVKTVE